MRYHLLGRRHQEARTEFKEKEKKKENYQKRKIKREEAREANHLKGKQDLRFKLRMRNKFGKTDEEREILERSIEFEEEVKDLRSVLSNNRSEKNDSNNNTEEEPLIRRIVVNR